MENKIEIAKNKAIEVLQEEKYQVPVDLNKIASRYKIRIVEGILNQDIAGFLKNDNGKAIIAVNKKNSEAKKRFTIAHEIGHFLLHTKKNVHVIRELEPVFGSIHFRDDKSSRAIDLDEIQANQFAAELLMPSVLIAKDAEKLKETNDNYLDIIEKLARKYQVSTTAMGVKIGAMTKF